MQFLSKATKGGIFYILEDPSICFNEKIVDVYNYILSPQVLPTCVILSKALNRNQRAEREAAAAAVSEFIRHM